MCNVSTFLHFDGGNVQEWLVGHKYRAGNTLGHGGVQAPMVLCDGKALPEFKIQEGHGLG